MRATIHAGSRSLTFHKAPVQTVRADFPIYERLSAPVSYLEIPHRSRASFWTRASIMVDAR